MSINVVRCAAAVLACALLVACAGLRTPGEPRKGGRVGKPTGPPVAVVARVIPCELGELVSAAFRRSSLEKHWQMLEDEIDQPFRNVVESGYLAKDALASLEHNVLARYDWTLTRFTVRVLRELEAEDLQSARTLLANEVYAEHALDDAMWDGMSGWDVVRYVRPELLEILEWLDDVRTGRVEVEEDSEDEQAPVLSAASLEADAQHVTDRLFETAAQLEPYSVGADCKPPDDPALRAVAYRDPGMR